MAKYIQFDLKTKKIIGISDLFDELTPCPKNMAPITDDQYSADLLHKIWDGTNFIVDPNPDIPEPNK